ncbi:MAG TPA: hypothetical protein VGI81_23740 [Tepidisphaeraceae bacterium]
MFRDVLFGCVALVAGSGVVMAAAQDDAKAATQKLADSQNYSWKTTTQAGGGGGGGRGAGGPSEGKIDKESGVMILTMTRGDNEIQVVKKGDKAVIKTPDNGWKTPAELAQDNNGGQPGPGRFMGRMVQGMQPPAKAAEELVADVKELTPSSSSDGWSGPLSEEGAKKAMAFGGGRRRGGADNANANANGPQISNAKGDVKFYTKDGVLAGYELHVTGTVDFNGNTRDIDRTTTVQISDVGSTKVEVPDEAKKKLQE